MEKSIGLLPSKNGEGHRLCVFCNKPVIRNLIAKFCSHSCNNKFNYKKRKEKVNTVLRVEDNTSSPV